MELEPAQTERDTATILVAEDDAAVRRLVCEMLKHSGYQVLAAADGLEAFSLWEAHHETIDLLLTDVIMPRMNGGELAQRISRSRPGVPVIFTSGYSHETIVHEIVPRSSFFLQKPFNHELLTRKVEQALGFRA